MLKIFSWKSCFFIGFIFCCSLNSIKAQQVKLVGKVMDSLNKPLPMASVIAKQKADNKAVTFSITNDEGLFQLKLPEGDTFILEISYLGMQTLNKEISTADRGDVIKEVFVLKPQQDNLKDVELIYEMPVTIKGDTIVYDADAFNRGDERKLKDVIKNIPGMDINDSGEIEVEGKVVQKVMVEGDDFFDGDSKLAAENIPADAVDKVEVLRNYNEVSQLKGLGNDQDNNAINIRLKEGKKKFWFGEATASVGEGGDEFRYLANPKLFYYSPDYSINVLANFNNIGESPLSFRDYFNFTGGFRNLNAKSGTQFNISDSGLGFLLKPNNEASLVENDFVASNFSYKYNEKLNFSGFGIYSGNRTGFDSRTTRNYIATAETENVITDTDQENNLGLIKLSTVYKPNSNFQLDYDALVNISKQNENSIRVSQFSDVENNIDELRDNDPVTINQNLNAYYTLSEKNIFAAQFQHLFKDEDPFYNAVLDVLPFAGILGTDNEQSVYNINQDRRIKTNKFDALVDYYRVLTKKSNLNFSTGVTYSHQSFNSGIFQLLDNGNRLDLNETPELDGDVFSLQNQVDYRFTDVFFGLRYRFVKGNFEATPGVSLHYYHLVTDQQQNTTSLNEWALLPELFAIYNFRRTESLRFNYRMTAEYTDVNNYAEGFIFNNYNSLFRGNRDLENALANSYTLSYFNFNMFNYITINANLNYTKRINGIKQNALIQNINQVTTPLNISSNFPDETYSGFGSFSKRFKKFQLSTSARISYSNFNNVVNNEVLGSESFTQNYEASIRTSLKEWPNLEVGYNYIRNRYDNGNTTSTFITDRPFANLTYQFLNGFEFEADWSYYNYKDVADTVRNEYSFLSSSLRYQKENSKWEYAIDVTNILGVESINNDSFNQNFNTTNEFFVLPRIIMATLRYSF
jgi:hypothetical protein